MMGKAGGEEDYCLTVINAVRLNVPRMCFILCSRFESCEIQRNRFMNNEIHYPFLVF